MSKRLFIYISLLALLGTPAFAQRPAADSPIKVSGNFSSDDTTASSRPAVTTTPSRDTIAGMQTLLKEQKFAEAVSAAENFLAKGNEDKRTNLILAQAYEGLGNWKSAEYHAREFIGTNPGDARGYIIRANAYYHMGNYADAKIDIGNALKINKDSTNAKRVKDLIDAATTTAQPARPQIQQAVVPEAAAVQQQQVSQKASNLRWWLIYIFFAIILSIIFIYIRNTSSSAKQKGATARKLDIKEQYNFIRQIGEGGMGKVYEAYDKALNRHVAIKRVRPELVRSDYVREQFLAEARTVALLRHPNIVEIYTVIESDSSLYLVFEFVDGQTLETRLDIDGFVPFSEAKKVFEKVCRGLQYAHSQDIIHCDLKPGNIMITDKGEAKVMDFGVAKRVVEDDTGARTVAGTPAYMAPEQQKGFMKKQSDIYSLGVCLYEGLVGQVPWSVAGFDIANKRIVPPSKLAPYIPKEVDELLEKALKEDPNERIQSIEEFWSILSKIEPLKEQPRPKHI
ncbi:tRNA A-37 threonylcarbamoyl transferase component Bud32/negative regulator of replication initiation [Elusimicrobium posterum]|uniref:serine/threonine-protein kinase n=1 Tax=Elusimicrobium posterum TaxID=3116653 RepID=UPI003C715849